MNKYKQGEYMTNLKKLGLTALAGSLAAVSAHAGEMSVSGGAIVSYTTGDAGNNSANSLGHKTDITFSGSGELDNGYTFDTFVFLKDDFSVISSSALTLTMGSMGTVGVSKGGGFNVNGGYDETYPRAYEENSDAGAQSSSNHVGNWADDNAIIYKAPSIDILGATVSVGAEYSLQADGSGTTSVITIPVADGVSNVISVNDTVVVLDPSNGLEAKGIVTASTIGAAAPAFTIQPFTGTSLTTQGLSLTGLKVFVYGSDCAKGSDVVGANARTSINPVLTQYHNSPIIIRDQYVVSGSDTAQIGWVNVATEDGTDGYLWYLKAESETRLRFEDYLEMAMVEGELNEVAATKFSNPGTQGLFAAIQER